MYKLKAVPLSHCVLFLALAALSACSDVHAQSDECQKDPDEEREYAACLEDLRPDPVQENTRLTIEVRLSPTLPADFDGKIHGGVIVWDTYNDESEGQFADELIAVAF